MQGVRGSPVKAYDRVPDKRMQPPRGTLHRHQGGGSSRRATRVSDSTGAGPVAPAQHTDTLYSVLCTTLNVCRYAVRDEMPYDESIDRIIRPYNRLNGPAEKRLRYVGFRASNRGAPGPGGVKAIKIRISLSLSSLPAVCCTACTGFTSFAHLLSLRYSQETNVRMSTAAHKDVPVGETRRQSAECAPERRCNPIANTLTGRA